MHINHVQQETQNTQVLSIPELERSPERGNGYPLQYSCLENPMDRGDWQAYSPQGHKESDKTEQACIIYDVCIYVK